MSERIGEIFSYVAGGLLVIGGIAVLGLFFWLDTTTFDAQAAQTSERLSKELPKRKPAVEKCIGIKNVARIASEVREEKGFLPNGNQDIDRWNAIKKICEARTRKYNSDYRALISALKANQNSGKKKWELILEGEKKQDVETIFFTQKYKPCSLFSIRCSGLPSGISAPPE